MLSIGRKTEHAGQTTITINGVHAYLEKAKQVLTKVSALLNGWAVQAAEQLNQPTVWNRCCDYLKLILTGIRPMQQLKMLRNQAMAYG